jgi:hypothetical protein
LGHGAIALCKGGIKMKYQNDTTESVDLAIKVTVEDGHENEGPGWNVVFCVRDGMHIDQAIEIVKILGVYMLKNADQVMSALFRKHRMMLWN